MLTVALQAPVLLFVIIGLVRQRAWLRPLGLFYAGAAWLLGRRPSSWKPSAA